MNVVSKLNKFENLIIACTFLVFLARIVGAIIFYFQGLYDSALVCFFLAAYYFASFFSYSAIKSVHAWLVRKKVFYKTYRFCLNHMDKNSKIFKFIAGILHFEVFKIRHLALVFYQAEVLFSTYYFSKTLGWGYGFDLYILILSNYFYLSIRKKTKLVYLFPLFYLAFYVWVYLSTRGNFNEDGMILMYLTNAAFALFTLATMLNILELGQVVRFINDENRKILIKNLERYDELTTTYQKYSFLEIMQIKLDQSAQEDMISQASVIIIEISNFKDLISTVNANLGNEVLKELAFLLKKNSENYDCYIARWSDNEFLLFIVNEDLTVVKNFVSHIKEIASNNRFVMQSTRVKLSFGAAHTSNFNYDLSTFIAQAHNDLMVRKEENQN